MMFSNAFPFMRNPLFAALLGLSSAAAQAGAPIGSTVTFKSLETGAFLSAWSDGAWAAIHAEAARADERAAVEVSDLGGGAVALRSIGAGGYWRLDGSDRAAVVCPAAAGGFENAAAFDWIENADGTLSLRARDNGLYLSVVREDTTMVPRYDSAAVAAIGEVQKDTLIDGAGRPSLLITPEMLKPYTVTYLVLRATASSIGTAEKFRLAAQPLGKTGAAARPSKVLTYMYQVAGQKTIGGIHNREPNSDPARWTNWINSTSGKYPGLWSGDFLFSGGDVSNRGTMINQAKAQWGAGAVVSIMYHMCPPTQGEVCGWSGGVQSKLSNDQWTQLIADGTALNATFKQRLKSIGTHFKTLQDAGVEVLFRPFHEMNQGAFWWGGRTGANGTARLYQITHDYLVGTMGLTNVFFVWSVQDLSWNFKDYDPGDKYWDVMSLDVYNGDGFTAKKYNAMLDVAGTKLIAIAETERIPTPAELQAQPRWSYFSGWSELTQQNNSAAAIKASYTAGNTLSRDELPGWANVVVDGMPSVGIRNPSERTAASMSLNAASHTLAFEAAEAGRASITLHHADGSLAAVLFDGMLEKGAHTAALPAAIPGRGVFFVKFAVRGASTSREITLLE